MFGLFKSKNPPQAPAAPAVPAAVPAPQAPAAGIAYYPRLIEELVGDHRTLERLQKDIQGTFQHSDFAKVSSLLQEFGSLLRGHLLKENMRLYVYLQQRVAGDEVNTAIVRSFRKEMDGVARTALDFLEKYQNIQQLSSADQLAFVTELEQIGKVVHGRMNREEQTLYPLYSSDI